MTLAEIMTMLTSITGFANKVTYRAWPVNEAPQLPYICFLTPYDNNFAADGIVYHAVKHVQIELYTEDKSPTVEETVEAALTFNNLFYEKSEEYIDTEKLYQVVYEIEV